MAYKYPICDVFHWFCKIARFFATEPFRLIQLDHPEFKTIEELTTDILEKNDKRGISKSLQQIKKEFADLTKAMNPGKISNNVFIYDPAKGIPEELLTGEGVPDLHT